MDEGFDKNTYEQLANEIFPGLTMYVRDVNLSPVCAEQYKPDMIIMERGFTDASCRVMGMVKMTLIHDLALSYEAFLNDKADQIIRADGRYAPCRGCFYCWIRTPATCILDDSLHKVCRLVGESENLTIITKNCYGGYSPEVKNILDRSIGVSTPLSTWRGKGTDRRRKDGCIYLKG